MLQSFFRRFSRFSNDSDLANKAWSPHLWGHSMNAELTTMTTTEQNGNTAIALIGPPANMKVPATKVVSDPVAIPAYIWCMLLAITSGMIGAYWDVAWHLSIGRDTFWTPAHVAIQLCGVLAGLTSAFLILSTTFGRGPAALARRAASLRIWSFRGPLGAFIAAWGAFAMVASAPFDNWWHNAYGLDVTILSPPHVVLTSGSVAIDIGTLILIGGVMNRSQGRLRVKLRQMFLYVGGIIVMHDCFLVSEHTGKEMLHSATAYLIVTLAVLVVLLGVARASEHPWAHTAIATIYTAGVLAQLWILPLFRAQPRLGPVYQNVTHFIPMAFPLLLVVPALTLDLLRRVTSAWRPWLQAAAVGIAFLVSFVCAQWPFASFLMSPLSRNRIFGTHYFAYSDTAGFMYDPYQFQTLESTRAQFWIVMTVALVVAILSVRLAFIWANWLKQVQR